MASKIKIEFVKETVNYHGISITIVKDTKKNRFRVKIGDETTAPIFDNEANAERFAAGCFYGLSYAFDIARKNGSNLFEKRFAQSK